MPDKRKTISVPSGGKVTIEVGSAPRKKRKRQAPETEGQGGIASGSASEDEVIRRKKPTISFYDLGTRLRSVPAPGTDPTRVMLPTETTAPIRNDAYFNEYVEILIDGEAIWFEHVAAEVSDETILSFDALLLGSLREESADTVSPLDTFPANVTGRILSACMPLPFAQYHWLYGQYVGGQPHATLDFERGLQTYHLWKEAIGEPVSSQWKERNTSHSPEKWNAINIAARTARHEGELQIKASSPNIRFTNTGLHYASSYEAFDTTDLTNFKITSAPYYESGEVALAVSPNARIFIRPKIYAFDWIQVVNFAFLGGTWWAGRMPVYPSWGSVTENADAASQPGFTGYNATVGYTFARSPIAQAQGVPTPYPPPYGQGLAFLTWTRPCPGMLCAIIDSKAGVFYIWRKTQGEEVETQDYPTIFTAP